MKTGVMAAENQLYYQNNTFKYQIYNIKYIKINSALIDIKAFKKRLTGSVYLIFFFDENNYASQAYLSLTSKHVHIIQVMWVNGLGGLSTTPIMVWFYAPVSNSVVFDSAVYKKWIWRMTEWDTVSSHLYILVIWLTWLDEQAPPKLTFRTSFIIQCKYTEWTQMSIVIFFCLIY